MKRRGRGLGFFWIVLIVAGIFMYRRDRETTVEERAASVERLNALVTPDAAALAAPEENGLAAAILIDVSGSMDEEADDSDTKKIVSARRAALDLVDQFARYARDNPTERVLLGIYEFSQRDGQPDCREVIPMGAPDRTGAERAINAMQPNGGTPIGGAMVVGKRALDATRLSRRHLLVVTDGENTDDPDPADVAAAIARRPTAEQPSIYFVAFDIDASRFNGVKEAGGLVLEAKDGVALNNTLDSLLRGRILVEQ